MTWLWFAIGSILFFTSVNLLQKILAEDSPHPRAMAVAFNGYAAIIAVTIFLISGSYSRLALPSSYSAWGLLLVAALLYALFERGRFVVARLLDASIFSIIINLSVVIAFVGSIFLYRETPTLTKILGAGLIVASLLLVSYQKAKKTKISAKGILLGTVISIFLGLGLMLDKLGAKNFSSDTYNFLIWVLPVGLIYLPYVKFSELVSEFKRGSWKIFLLAGLNVLGYLMQLKALELQEATRVSPITQTSL